MWSATTSSLGYLTNCCFSADAYKPARHLRYYILQSLVLLRSFSRSHSSPLLPLHDPTTNSFIKCPHPFIRWCATLTLVVVVQWMDGGGQTKLCCSSLAVRRTLKTTLDNEISRWTWCWWRCKRFNGHLSQIPTMIARPTKQPTNQQTKTTDDSIYDTCLYPHGGPRVVEREILGATWGARPDLSWKIKIESTSSTPQLHKLSNCIICCLFSALPSPL